MSSIGIGGSHDVGGMVSDEFNQRINMHDRQLEFWEIRVHALLVILSIKSLITTDELRRGVEGLEPKIYKQWGYYDKWSASIATILLERQIMSSNEFDIELMGDEVNNTTIDGSVPILFKPGDIVRIKNEDSRIRWRKPHIRVPGYIYGKLCKIEHYVGSFDDPYLKAFRGIGPKQPLYSVSFSLAAIRSTGESIVTDQVMKTSDNYHESDTLYTDIYQDWLELEVSSTSNQLAVEESHRPAKQAKLHHHLHDSSKDSEAELIDVVSSHSINSASEDQILVNHDHNHNHIHQNRYEVECVAINNELKSVHSPGKLISEALLKILFRKNIITNEELQRTIENLESAGVSMIGATLVVHAWKDASFKSRLLENAQSAAAELGIITSNPNAPTVLKVVENTTIQSYNETPVVAIHNIIVCTLCSCYPTGLLGFSPSWYKSSSYRARVVVEPRKVLAEFGTVLSKDTIIRVHDSTADCRYLVLPLPPKDLTPTHIKELTVDELKKFVTRDSMIGVSVL